MTLKALWKTSRLMGVPRSYTHSITKPEVTWSVQGEKGKDNKIPKNPTNVLLCVIKFGNENKIHLAGYKLFGGHSSEAQCSSSREGEGKNVFGRILKWLSIFETESIEERDLLADGLQRIDIEPKKSIRIVFNDHAKNIERLVFLVEFYGEVQFRSKE